MPDPISTPPPNFTPAFNQSDPAEAPPLCQAPTLPPTPLESTATEQLLAAYQDGLAVPPDASEQRDRCFFAAGSAALACGAMAVAGGASIVQFLAGANCGLALARTVDECTPLLDEP